MAYFLPRDEYTLGILKFQIASYLMKFLSISQRWWK